MQVQSLHGYFDNGVFFQQGRRVSLPEHKHVIVNILDIPVDTDEIRNEDIKFWKEFDRLADESADEELVLANFPRVHFGRELIVLGDEE